MDNDKYEEEIRILKTPQEEFVDGDRIMMNWYVKLSNNTSQEIVDCACSDISDIDLSLKVNSFDGQSGTFSMTSGSKISYEKFIDRTFRAFLLIEKQIGPIAIIQNIPRDEWRRMFHIIDVTGALDIDKTPLMLAARRGDLGLVMEILSTNNGIDINAISPNGNTALIEAILGNNIEIVKFLIRQGANINVQGDVHSPLHAAVTRDDVQLVEVTLKAGANVNAVNRYGETPLMFAASRGVYEIVSLLLNNGADPVARDKKGQSALDRAIRNNRSQVTQILEQAIKTV